MNTIPFERLILLIGTNPLPNFVIAEYFLRNSDSLREIVLIYSEKTIYQRGTKFYAESLQRLLESHHKDKGLKFFLILLSNISSAEEIERNLNKSFLNLDVNKSVHLNYTGGTKVMGIHVYRWLNNKVDSKDIGTSFSYLDARTFQIMNDEYGSVTGDLRKEVKLNIQELISLHGFERKNNQSNLFNIFEAAIKGFKNLIDNDNLKKYFYEYKRDLFLDKRPDKKSLVEQKTYIRDELRSYVAKGVLLEIVKLMQAEYRIFDDKGAFVEPKSNNYLKETVRFLDGTWLELYVYNILKNNLADQNILIDINWEIKKSEWRSPNQKFELDVILLNGYQLIGISCTTSSERYICKSKGFEIFLRTRQIGGGEARALLVTRLSESQRDELQAELEIDTGGKENILVLGEDDLKEEVLVEKIKDFIK
jgi:hypothetical protein